MLSFWEQKEFIRFDYIIVGSGITGLSTACVLKERNPNAKILILERGLFPTGASTKNAGFACIGTLSEKVYDLSLMGEKNLLQLVENRWKGLQLLRKRLGDAKIDFQNNGGYELVFNSGIENHLDKIDFMNAMLFPLFGKNIFVEKKDKIDAFGFNKKLLSSIVENEIEGQLDTGKMMNSLHDYAASLGIKIITGAEVNSIEENNHCVEILVSCNQSTQTFKAEKTVVCTNAFTKKLFPELEIIPGRGQVICTSPIENLKIKGTFNFDEGFYYFRNFENRIIFGGGRNLDFEKERTTNFELNETIISKLEWYLKELIIPEKQFTIDYKWTGIMAFGENKLPIVQRMSDRIAVGARLNGMGVALGSKIAEDLADLLQ